MVLRCGFGEKKLIAGAVLIAGESLPRYLSNLVSKPMTRMEAKVDGMEKELETVKSRLEGLDGRLEAMNGNMENVNGRIVGVDSGMETLNKYLHEVRELLVTREARTTDKRKAPVEPHP